MKIAVSVSLLAILATNLGCATRPSQPSQTARDIIKQSLDRLMSSPEEDEPFVTITHKPTGKFVQFVGSTTRPLLLDLPAQTLDAAERERARKFFAARGLHEPLKYDLGDPKNGGWTQLTWNLRLGHDTALAADTAVAIFAEVFRLKPEPGDLDLKGLPERK